MDVLQPALRAAWCDCPADRRDPALSSLVRQRPAALAAWGGCPGATRGDAAAGSGWLTTSQARQQPSINRPLRQLADLSQPGRTR
ncbi:hypothetical protein MRX96_026468 [Rhipicephalus microplus]